MVEEKKANVYLYIFRTSDNYTEERKYNYVTI